MLSGTLDFLNHRALKPEKIYENPVRPEIRGRMKGGPQVSLYNVKVDSAGFLLVPF